MDGTLRTARLTAMVSLAIPFLLAAALLAAMLPRLLQPILGAMLVGGAVVAWPLLGTGQSREQLASRAQQWLETRYDRSGVTDSLNPAGIIVLGGGYATYVVDKFSHATLTEDGRSGRMVAAGNLARRFPQAKVVYTGRGEEGAREAFAGMGIAEGRILMEPNSASTFENARNTAALLHPQSGQRWILVTSAMHMPRAVLTLRSQGFDVVPYPVDYIAAREPNRDETLPPLVARRELAAMVGYILTGRITVRALW